MSLTYNRIHRHLGLAPRQLTFLDVVDAVESGLEENEDLDWKVQLPDNVKDHGWDEFAKDVAAMANTAGGILVYGVADTLSVRGLSDPDPVNRLSILLQKLSAQVSPAIAGIETTALDESPNGRKLIIVSVPASEFAPHLVLSLRPEDRSRGASIVPRREGSQTRWMTEFELAQAYRRRFSDQAQHRERLLDILGFAKRQALRENEESGWVVFAALPVRASLQRSKIPRQDVIRVLEAGLKSSLEMLGDTRERHPVLQMLDKAAFDPQSGYRRWVISNQLSPAFRTGSRPVTVELHDDGGVTLAVDAGWSIKFDRSNGTIPVHADVVDKAVREFVGLISAVSAYSLSDEPVSIAAIMVSQSSTTKPLVVMFQNSSHPTETTFARQVPEPLTVEAELLAPVNLIERRFAASDLASGLLNQFGFESHLPRPVRER